MKRWFAFSLASALAYGCLAPAGAASQDGAGAAPQEQATVVDPLVIAPLREVPIPHVGEGAPAFTARELDVMRERAECVWVSNIKARHGFGRGKRPQGRALLKLQVAALEATDRFNKLQKAARATEHAEAVRREAALGRRSQDEVVAAELARQQAVIALGPIMPPVEAAVAVDPIEKVAQIEDLVARDQITPEGRVIRFTGRIRNTGGKPIRIPDLRMTVLDARDFIIATEQVGTRAGFVEPGAAESFAWRLSPVPKYADSVLVAPVEAAPRRVPGRGPACV